MPTRNSVHGIADQVDMACRKTLGIGFPLGLHVWDGSVISKSNVPSLIVKSPEAVRHVLRAPGGLGLARAYVAGHVDVHGDMAQALEVLFSFGRQVRAIKWRSWHGIGALASAVLQLGVVGTPPGVPVEEARLSGRPHTRNRDQAAIAHHYDLGNDFYATILDPTMSYSCGYWGHAAIDHGLAQAQLAKLDLICNKLNLRSGQRMLDLGCGWGALVLHAAEHYGVRATGVTVSKQQREFVRSAVADRGLDALVDVRLLDYRDVPAEQFDAVCSVEMGEHVGDENYAAYCASMHDRLRPCGRLLVQQMSCGDRAPGENTFIERYIAPDMTMRPLNRTLAYLEDTGLELREVVSLREHYVHTIRAWSRRLDDGWDEVVGQYGARRARIWRLYLTGVAQAFERNHMNVHQILAVRCDADGTSDMPLRAEWSTPKQVIL